MNKPISKCPACQETLRISLLSCPNCGTELKGSFELSPFDKLGDEQYAFLLSFLRNRGNLKNLQEELQISYPTAKKTLDDILRQLGLIEDTDLTDEEWEAPDMENWTVDANSTKASEIIKAKIKENGGRVVIHTVTGLPCEIGLSADGKTFLSNKLPLIHYGIDVFDCIVELLLANGGRARKGNGRNFKLGDPNCDESTVVGYIGKHYSGKHDGDSVFDPVFVFAAVLEWAGIAHNGRGEISLTAAYREMLR